MDSTGVLKSDLALLGMTFHPRALRRICFSSRLVTNLAINQRSVRLRRFGALTFPSTPPGLMRSKQQGLGTQLALKRVQDEAWGLQRNTAEQCAVALSAEDHRRRSLTTIELKENVAYAARNPQFR